MAHLARNTVARNILALAVSLGLAAGAAVAAGKPKGAQPTDPQVIWKLFAGKTSHWNQGGTAYWGPDGTYRGVNRNGDAIGEGKWYVTTASKMCHESVWRKAQRGSSGSEVGKWCWEFVTAPDGQIWERFLPDRSDWYRHRPEKQRNGETHRRQFRQLKAQAGG